MLGIVILNYAMTIRVASLDEWQKELVQNGYKQRGIHLSLENAQLGATTAADPSPNMDLHWMLGLGLVARLLPPLIVACPAVCLYLNCALISVDYIIKIHVLVLLCPFKSFHFIRILYHLTVAR